MFRVILMQRIWLALAGGAVVAGGCSGDRREPRRLDTAAARVETMDTTHTMDTTRAAVTDSAPRRVAVVKGFQHPESARYDAGLDVWFVSNINGDPTAKDNNGFISRLKADGSVDRLKFIAGGRGGVTLNAPKGLAIVGDTLWVADLEAARAFNKRTGAPVATVDLAGQAKFLNDAAVGPDGVYFTDTGISSKGGGMIHTGPDRIFRVGSDRKATIALESNALEGPNGITWDAANRRFIVVPFAGSTLFAWTPGEKAPRTIGTGPGQQDGVELLPDGRLLFSSWSENSLLALRNGRMTKVISNLPSPADFGVDPKRHRVAVPLLMQDRVELWELP